MSQPMNVIAGSKAKRIDPSSIEVEKAAELIGRTFYRMLRKRGFSENQIITVAANIISCLTDSLKEYQCRKERKGKDQEKRNG